MVFLKEFFEKVDFEKNQQTTNYAESKELTAQIVRNFQMEMKYIVEISYTFDTIIGPVF